MLSVVPCLHVFTVSSDERLTTVCLIMECGNGGGLYLPN